MPDRIFISYARRDARTLALRLQADLIGAGYDVWLDTSEIDGGASWSREIEDAIESCDCGLALLSHGAFESEICRAEQLRLLRKRKRVIPLLVQVDAERPLHLEALNYRNFSDDAQYTAALDLLRADLAGKG
ncbi:MAG: toll/interleukin-1 receptor domain-containing protein, partial [Anaerolinea sp.]|nr:toll/interleukin-1 receptor domain-containing protein [Anaerolinea sp.]